MNTQGRIGSGDYGGAAENIVITGNAVVNANGGIGGGAGEDDESNGDRKTSITISGNAQVNATDKVDNGSDYGYEGNDASLAVIGGGYGGTAEITISGSAHVNAKAEARRNMYGSYGAGAVIGGGAGSRNGKKSYAKVTIEGDTQVTAENSAYGGGANGTGEVIIGGKAQVKATGSAEHYEKYGRYGAGAAIGNGGTTFDGSTGTVQKGENQFSTDKESIQDGAKVEMTNIGHNSSNTVTKTRRNGDWVTKGDEEQPPETCDHSNPSKGKYLAEKVYPNCTEKGSETYRCSSCGEVVDTVELPVNPNYHKYVWVKFPATCTKDGYSVYTCSLCGKPRDGKPDFIVKAPGHKPVETVVAPTCTESGYTVQKCSVCGEETGEHTNICLLYTSPSPRDGLLSRMPSSA